MSTEQSEFSPSISVALVTRNRPDSLEQTLRSLRAQSVQPCEVVISDDSNEDSAEAAAHLAAQYACRYVRGPQRGLYANRNHAARACRGTHIRTMDDDHTFLPGHFSRCQEALMEDPRAVWIIGEYTPREEKPGVMPLCPGQLNPRGSSDLPPDPQNCWAIADGATIYPRTVFDSGAHYVEDFKFGASYLEFGSRLHWLGYRIRYLQDTYLLHNYLPNARSYASEEMEQASRFFAIFCHSFLYQPTVRNRALTLAEIGIQFIRRPTLAARALRAGLTGYHRQRQSELCQARLRALNLSSALMQRAGDQRQSPN